VLPPAGPRWLIAPSLAEAPGLGSVIVAFGRRPAEGLQNGPEGLRTVVAAVSTRDHGTTTFESPEAFLRFEEGEAALAIGAQVSRRHRVVSATTVLDRKRGPRCVKYDYLVEDNGVRGFEGTPFTFEFHGSRCLHPTWPRYAVDVGYSERYRSAPRAAGLDAELAPFLDGLVFTDERPVFVATILIGHGPQGLAFADGSVWVAYGDQQVARIDPRTNLVAATVQVGRHPVGLATGQEGLWVVNRDDGTVGRIDPGTNRMSAVVQVGGKPLTAACGAGSVWVTDPAGGFVTRIDPAAARVLARIPAGKEPSIVAVGAGAVWVTDFRGDKLLRLDPATNAVAQTVDVGLRPSGMAADERSVWVGNQWDLTVAQVDPSSGKVLASVPFRTRPGGLAVSPGTLWVSAYDEGDVSRIDLRTGKIVGEPIPVGKRPVLMIWAADALWVSNAYGDSVSRIDP